MQEKEWKDALNKVVTFVDKIFSKPGTQEYKNGVLAFKIKDVKTNLGEGFEKVSDAEVFSRLSERFDNRGMVVDEREHIDGSLIIQIFKSDSTKLKELIESGEYTEVQDYA
jgi:transposase